MGTLFLVSLISFKAFRYIISVLGSVKILQRKGPIKGITCNGELGTSEQNSLSSKVITYSISYSN